MEVYHVSYPNHLFKNETNESYALALGFFDGVHAGHQAVIQEALNKGKERNIKTAVMTFDPHPSLVLGGRKEQIFYITPLEQKIEILSQLQVDAVFVVRFTSDFAKLTPAEFIESFIKQANVKHVTAGFDFTFGAFGKGTMEDMEQLSEGKYTVSVVGKQELSGEKISSTRIREELKSGNMEKVKDLLGRPFMLSGVVVHGDKRGRTIDFPTAIIPFLLDANFHSIHAGCRGELTFRWLDVGFKPTFNNPDEKRLSIEVHIIDFDQSIYGEEVIVHWYMRIRSEQKFDGIEALKAQITKDKLVAIDYFRQS